MKSGRFAKVISKLTRPSADAPAGDTRAARMPIEASRDSVADPCRIAPGRLGISTTTRMCVQRPSGVLDICVFPAARAASRAERYAECNIVASQHDDRSVCHNPCLGTSAAFGSSWSVVVERRSPRWSAAITNRHSHWPGPRLRLMGHHPRQSPSSFLSHFWRDRWGWGQQRPPKPGLAQHTIGRLPFPLDIFQIVTLPHQLRPQLLKEPDFTPMRKATKDSAVVTIDPRDAVPLATCAQVKNNAIHHPPTISALPASAGRRVQPVQQRLHARPQRIWYFPQSWRCWFAFGHRNLRLNADGHCRPVRVLR